MSTKTIAAFVSGLLFGSTVVLFASAHFYGATIQKLTDQAVGGIHDQQSARQQIVLAANGTIEGLNARVAACEAKFAVGTIIYQPQAPAPLLDVPVLDGLASVQLRAGAALPGTGAAVTTTAAWFIPVETKIYGNLPGASYSWQNMRTGETRGPFPVQPPSALGGQQ